MDYLAVEKRVFDLNETACFKELYAGGPPPSGLATIPERIANKLMTVCSVLHEYPIIRLKNKPNNPMMQVARLLKVGFLALSSLISVDLSMLTNVAPRTNQQKLDELQQSSPGWWCHGGNQAGDRSRRPQSTLLLLDRSDDCVSPVLHTCTYQVSLPASSFTDVRIA